jgi:hypothetical protein
VDLCLSVPLQMCLDCTMKASILRTCYKTERQRDVE